MRGGRLGLALRTLITIRDEVTVDSQPDARIERRLKKVTYMIDNLGVCPIIAAAVV